VSAVFRQPCDEGVARATKAAAPCSPRAAPWVLAATILGSSMVFVDGTVVNVALPALQADLGATLVDVQWIVESYALLLAALLLTGGALGDRFGRRRVFLSGAALFGLASVACALAPGVGALVAFRALQGIGGALLVPGSLAILAASFSDHERGRAIGTWAGFSALAGAVGPVLGGWLIDHLSWRWAFLVNVPPTCAVLLISRWRVPESRDEEAAAAPLDLAGAVLATTGLGGAVYALLESANRGWSHPAVLGALALGLASAAAFVAVERRARAPMLRLELFRSRNFAAANLLTLFLYAALSGVLVYLPLDLIQVQGYTAAEAGASLLPFVLLMLLLSRFAGGLYDRFGAKRPLTVGGTVAGAGFALFAVPDVGGSYFTTFFPAVLVLGLGITTCVAPLTTTVMNAVPARHAGVASGINNAVSRAAGLIAVAVFSAVVLHLFAHRLAAALDEHRVPEAVRSRVLRQATRLAAVELPPGLPEAERAEARRAIDEAFVAGFRRVSLLGAGLALLSAGVAAVLIDGGAGRRTLGDE
jgi:EmrB/QacA subfamily drug resistance transporter